jgi:hypothetical protein
MQATFFFSNDDCFIYGLSFSMLPSATFTIASSGLLPMTWSKVNKTASKNNILLIIEINSTNNHHSSSFRAITCNLSEAKIKGKEYNTK